MSGANPPVTTNRHPAPETEDHLPGDVFEEVLGGRGPDSSQSPLSFPGLT